MVLQNTPLQGRTDYKAELTITPEQIRKNPIYPDISTKGVLVTGPQAKVKDISTARDYVNSAILRAAHDSARDTGRTVRVTIEVLE